MASPTLDTPQADATLTEGDAYAAELRSNFSDADAPDTLTFSVAGLPANTGLVIDPESGVLSGTPSNDDIAAAPITVTITATDGSSNSNSVDITLSVASNELAAGGSNLFLDPVNGNDAWDGEYGEFLAELKGPKKTWAGIAALDLSLTTGIWFKAGSTITGVLVDVDTAFIGAPADFNVIGAYYLEAGAAFRGLNSLPRVIIQGTVTRPLDYDGTKNLTGAQHFPSFTEGAGNFTSESALLDLSMQPGGNPLRKATAIARYIDVENIFVRHSGGAGFKSDAGSDIIFTNTFSDCTAGPGYQIQRTVDVIVEDSFMTASAYGDEYYGHDIGTANAQANQSDRITYRRNLAWLNYGEVFDSFATSTGANDNLFEDNVSFDTTRLHFYNSAGSRNVIRRNLTFQSNRVATKAGHDFSGQKEAFRQFAMMAAEPQEALNSKSVDCAIYSNISIFGMNQLSFADQYRQVNGGAQHDFLSMYAFHNTFIAGFKEIDTDSGGADPKASDGKCQYNMFLFPTDTDGVSDNQHKVRLVGWADADQKHNGWDSTLDSQTTTWINNIASPAHSHDTTGWDSLETLATWDLHNGHGMSIDNAIAFVAAVKAKLGVPSGNAADVSADAVPGHPTSITIASYDGLDFNGDAFVTNDLGAIRA